MQLCVHKCLLSAKGELKAGHHRHNCLEKQNCMHVTLLLVFVSNVWLNWSRQVTVGGVCTCLRLCVFGPWQWCQQTVSHWALFVLIISCYSLLSPLIRGQSKIGSGTNGICTHTVGWTTLGCKVRGGTTQSKLRVLNVKVSLWVISSAKQQGERNTPEMRMCLFDLSWVLISRGVLLTETVGQLIRTSHWALTLEEPEWRGEEAGWKETVPEGEKRCKSW